MPKIHELSTLRAKRARMTGRFALAAVIAAVVVVAGIATVTPLGDLSSAALADARATIPIGAKRSAPASDSAGADPVRVFDYFPDHYVNQAKEPAEPIASF